MSTANETHGIPASGTPVDELLESIRAERSGDLDWAGGKAFSLVYNTDDPELARLQHEVASIFLHENALNPFRYQTLLRMEGELLAMATGPVRRRSGGALLGRHGVDLPRGADRTRPRPGPRRHGAAVGVFDHRAPCVREGVQVPRCRDGPPRRAPRRSSGPGRLRRGHRRPHCAARGRRRRATPTASSTPWPTSPASQPTATCCATSTPASAATCCRGGSSSASRSPPGTSGSTA